MDLKVLWTISNTMGTASDIKMLKNVDGFNINVITCDSVQKDSIGYVITGEKHVIPEPDSSEYIPSLIDLCTSENVTTIIPQKGAELVPLSRNINLFDERNIKVLVTEDSEKLEIANNKGKLYEFFQGCDFIPHHEYVHSIEQIEKAIYKLGYPDVPVCIKPVFGEGSRGFWIITNEEVNIFKQSSANSKLSWPLMKRYLENKSEIPYLMVSEYLPGLEYSVDCVCKDGTTYICIPRVRMETSMGVATVSLIERNNDIEELSREIISKLNLSYNINLQFKYSSSGHPKLLEINPRVSGSLVANLGAGVNMLEKSLKLAYGMPLGDISVKWGTKMIRYWEQVFI